MILIQLHVKLNALWALPMLGNTFLPGKEWFENTTVSDSLYRKGDFCQFYEWHIYVSLKSESIIWWKANCNRSLASDERRQEYDWNMQNRFGIFSLSFVMLASLTGPLRGRSCSHPNWPQCFAGNEKVGFVKIHEHFSWIMGPWVFINGFLICGLVPGCLLWCEHPFFLPTANCRPHPDWTWHRRNLLGH